VFKYHSLSLCTHNFRIFVWNNNVIKQEINIPCLFFFQSSNSFSQVYKDFISATMLFSQYFAKTFRRVHHILVKTGGKLNLQLMTKWETLFLPVGYNFQKCLGWGCRMNEFDAANSEKRWNKQYYTGSFLFQKENFHLDINNQFWKSLMKFLIHLRKNNRILLNLIFTVQSVR